MTSYNQVNGEYASESRHLLREILKGDWAYPGFVMSDFFYGVHDGVKAAHAGLDLEMPWTVAYGRKLQTAVARSEVPLALIDDAVLRILRRKIVEMESMVATLDHLAQGCSGDDRPDCPILADLEGEASLVAPACHSGPGFNR